MRRCWFLLLSMGLAGCGMSSNGLQYEAVSEQNIYRIARTQKGMSEAQVLRIMHRPYSYESFQIDDDVYDVWFYVTKTTGLDQTRMVPQNLTPLTFKNGVLVGSGYYWYYYAMREQLAAEAAKNPPPPKPKTQEEQDKEFEKELRPPGKTPVASEPPATPAKPAKKAKKTKTKPENAPEVSALLSSNDQVLGRRSPVAAGVHPWTPSPMGAIQRKKLSEVRIGMTESEVTRIIGAPSDYRTYEIDGDTYDVWFYEVMNRTGTATSLPLTFKNSTLVGMTDRYYNKIKAKAEPDGVNGYNRGAERMQEDESEQNFDFW